MFPRAFGKSDLACAPDFKIVAKINCISHDMVFIFLTILIPMLYKTLSYFLVWPNQICFGTTRHPSLWQHNRHQREQKKSRTPFFAQCALQKISKTRCKKVMSFSVSLCLNYSRSKNRKKPLGMCKITGL